MFDFEITNLFVSQEQPGKIVVYIPALIILAFIASFNFQDVKRKKI